jgi:hypothetical protein
MIHFKHDEQAGDSQQCTAYRQQATLCVTSVSADAVVPHRLSSDVSVPGSYWVVLLYELRCSSLGRFHRFRLPARLGSPLSTSPVRELLPPGGVTRFHGGLDFHFTPPVFFSQANAYKNPAFTAGSPFTLSAPGPQTRSVEG